MKYTQFLIFEITDKCNMSKQHEFCPCETRTFRRGAKPLTDDKIVSIAAEAYNEHGFRGMIGWHYYCEPMLEWRRVFPLMRRIKAEAPSARFVLWTNGTIIPDDDLGMFEQIHVSAYDPEKARAFHEAAPHALVEPIAIDDRLSSRRPVLQGQCWRPFTEMIIDYAGQVHACCYDWRGQIAIASVHKSKLSTVLGKWRELRAQLAARGGMSADAPAPCRNCQFVCGAISSFVPEARDAVLVDLPRIRAMASEPPAVIAVAYRIPEHRVRAFCEWNDVLFKSSRARVYIVVDKTYDDLPAYVTQVVYTEHMDVFSLAKTKNAGIAMALVDQTPGVIIASDIDIVFPEPAWHEMVGTQRGNANVPLYLMAKGYDVRATQHDPAPKATGTVAMHWRDWAEHGIRYEERCKGYGSDDAILLRDIAKAGVTVDRVDGCPVYHIAHRAGTCQREFAGRTDHWNRDNGFNPENFAHNRQFYDRGA